MTQSLLGRFDFFSAILYRHGFWPKVMKKEERKRKALLEAEKRKALLHKHFLILSSVTSSWLLRKFDGATRVDDG